MKFRMKTSHVVKLVIQDIVWYGILSGMAI